MEYLINFFISLVSSTVGAVCGIGGGIIIKPVLDAFGTLGGTTIHFLSGCTVLAMTLYSVVSAKIARNSLVDRKSGTPMAIGAAAGGALGKMIFQALVDGTTNQDTVGLLQALMLLGLTAGTLIYSLNKGKIKTKHLSGTPSSLVVGGALGLVSAFLGIGGGPFNMIVLYYFFSMPVKTAVQNSLYIILFSQLASLINTLISGTVPPFLTLMLLLMVAGGICGRILNKRLDDKNVSRLFVVVLVIIMGISGYNALQFM